MLSVLLYNLKSLFRKLLNDRIYFTSITSQHVKELGPNTGYADPIIFENMVRAHNEAMLVEDKFERDGVLCNHPNYDFYILTIIYEILLKQDTVTVLDIGGGMASKYYQNHRYLASIENLNWVVIEQKHIVEYCNKNISSKNLNFQEFDKISSDKIYADVVIISSAMQYFDEPYEMLNKLLSVGAKKVIIEKTPFIMDSDDKRMLQKLPKKMYEAKYICWFFSVNKFKDFLKQKNIVEYDEYNLKMHFYAGEEWKRFILSTGANSVND